MPRFDSKRLEGSLSRCDSLLLLINAQPTLSLARENLDLRSIFVANVSTAFELTQGAGRNLQVLSKQTLNALGRDTAGQVTCRELTQQQEKVCPACKVD